MAVRVRVPLAALTYLSLMQMKRIAFLFLTLLLLVSCGTRSGYFKMEGRFLHMNSGELYLYSPDGGIDGMDTINTTIGAIKIKFTRIHVQETTFHLEVTTSGTARNQQQ